MTKKQLPTGAAHGRKRPRLKRQTSPLFSTHYKDTLTTPYPRKNLLR